MNFRDAIKTAAGAARANLLPGVLLQALLIVFLSAYVAHEGTRAFLREVADFKEEAGYAFAFVSYVIACAVLPEVLRVAFFQGGRVTRRNIWNFATAAPIWGAMGGVVDAFYRLQQSWFGAEPTFSTILLKVLIDQFVFSPFFAQPLIVSWFFLRDRGFRRDAWRQIFRPAFVWEHIFPVQVAAWMVWIPAVSLVYFMPPLLQIPVAVSIQVFWILIFTTVGERLHARDVARGRGRLTADL